MNNMKEYEIYSDMKVPLSSTIILRLDGRGFHTISKNLNLKRPYDEVFSFSMAKTAEYIFKEFSPLFIYTFSDELNILLKEIPFNGRIEKLNSVFPSFASSSLTLNLNESLDEKITLPISFDSRIIPISDIVSYFKWRQNEAWRNHVNGYGYWALRKTLSKHEATSKLNGLSSGNIHQLLFEKGINLNDFPLWQKRGIAIYKKKQHNNKNLNNENNNKSNKYSNNNKHEIFTDLNLEIFNNEFFESIFGKYF
ncbi:tRNA(His) guanylyltransferase Thg1 family protein [Methanobrevibacter filiformis]|uniref:tRNA(His) guanylyltransferase n=1 Tax=Methanobrevibacter filiformis TaxID=55758 RepID=A0A166CVT7_9EURY|nr:tRNA(His) guanylyltransferase Thg1 family protein [Methanobrevibacter filiformis]KZX14915.1 tRNAHis guanylyltransferase [Methanobrevibacter filiformis]